MFDSDIENASFFFPYFIWVAQEEFRAFRWFI